MAGNFSTHAEHARNKPYFRLSPRKGPADFAVAHTVEGRFILHEALGTLEKVLPYSTFARANPRNRRSRAHRR